MARYAKPGVLAVGLISGLTLFISYPHLQKSLRRFSKWLMTKSMKSLETHSDENFPNHPCTTLSKPSDSSPSSSPEQSLSFTSRKQFSGTPQYSDEFGGTPQHSEEFGGTPQHLDEFVRTPQHSDESDNETDVSEDTSSSDEENKKIIEKSVFPNNLPQNGKIVIQKLEAFNIFTETVTYKPKQDRDISDKTVYCKNLFLKDRKGKFYFIICREDNNVNLRQLKYKLHAHRNFSFATSDEVLQFLKVQPGCITPFAFLSEEVSKDITFALSRDLMFEKKLNFHPLHAEFATRISFGLLLKLFGHLQRKCNIIDI